MEIKGKRGMMEGILSRGLRRAELASSATCSRRAVRRWRSEALGNVVFLFLTTCTSIWGSCLCLDIMLQMGFSLEEIQDSLVNQKYNDVMAAYLLLDYRNSEVRNPKPVRSYRARSSVTKTPAFERHSCTGDLFGPSIVAAAPLELPSDHRFVFLPSVGGRLHQA